jgi:peptide/nickel transport system permease protein
MVGGTIGIVSGYFRGRVETFLMGFCDVLLSFPALLLALSIVAFRGDQRDLLTISLAISSNRTAALRLLLPLPLPLRRRLTSALPSVPNGIHVRLGR